MGHLFKNGINERKTAKKGISHKRIWTKNSRDHFSNLIRIIRLKKQKTIRKILREKLQSKINSNSIVSS